MHRLLLILNAFLTVTARAQAPRLPDQYTRLLLPFHASLPTGTGTRIVLRWFRNEDTTPADAFPLALQCGLPPPSSAEGPRVFMRGYPALPPGTTLTCEAGDVRPSFLIPPFVPVVSAAPGALLYVETASMVEVLIGGSVRWVDIANRTGAAEMRVEVVPESSSLRWWAVVSAMDSTSREMHLYQPKGR
jgi:hypothetical protein